MGASHRVYRSRLLLGAFGGQQKLVLPHSDCTVEIIVNGGPANHILLVPIRDRAEENRSAERTLQCRVAILSLHSARNLVAVLLDGPLLGQDALNRAMDRNIPASSHIGDGGGSSSFGFVVTRGGNRGVCHIFGLVQVGRIERNAHRWPNVIVRSGKL